MWEEEYGRMRKRKEEGQVGKEMKANGGTKNEGLEDEDYAFSRSRGQLT
jgi:hypothetical protein